MPLVQDMRQGREGRRVLASLRALLDDFRWDSNSTCCYLTNAGGQHVDQSLVPWIYDILLIGLAFRVVLYCGLRLCK
jgi:hypothetical protein